MNMYPFFLAGYVYLILLYMFTMPKGLMKSTVFHFFSLKTAKVAMSVFEIFVIIIQLYNPRLLHAFSGLPSFGLALFVAGLIILTWAKYTMGAYWALPGEVKNNQEDIVMAGPFRFSRNPIYLGRILTLVGFEIALGSLLLLVVIPAVLATHKTVLVEEASLRRKFGKKYEIYIKNVPRYLLFF